VKDDKAAPSHTVSLSFLFAREFIFESFPTMESTAIIKHLHIDEERRMKLFALSVLLVGRVVDKTQLDLYFGRRSNL
jgi:hypothetical protein